MSITKARIGLLIVAIVWGIGYIATDISLEKFNVFQMQTLRFTISALVLGIIFYKKLFKIKKRTILFGITLGLVFFMAMSLHSVALETTTVSKNAFLVVFNIVFVPLIMYIFFKVKVEKHFFLGVLLMLIGFFILIFVDFSDLQATLANIQSNASLVLGDYFTLLSSFIFGVHIVLIGLFVQKEDAIALVIIQLTTTALLSLSVSLITGNSIIPNNVKIDDVVLFAVVFLGLVGTISFAGQISLQKHLPASNVALIFSTESIFAAIASVALGLEPLTANLLIGAIIITLGIIIAETGFDFKK